MSEVFDRLTNEAIALISQVADYARHEVDSAAVQVAALRELNANLSTQVNDLIKAERTAVATVGRLTDGIDELKKKFNAKSFEAGILQTKLDDVRGEVSRLEEAFYDRGNMLDERDDRIAQLMAEVDALTTKLKRARAKKAR